MSEREMYDEVVAMVGAIAKALDLGEAEAAKAVEDGRVSVELGSDDRGQRFVRVALDGRAARIYPGAILHETEAAPERGGCSCGH